MKKNQLFKIISIAFLVVFLLTWIIPSGGYSTGSFESSGIDPLGIFNLARTPLIAVTNLIQYSIYFIVLGAFYGVLNKTGVYTGFVNMLASRIKNNKLFLIIITSLFILISSFAGLTWALFLLVPFISAIILKLGYKNMTAMLSTVGAILVGVVGNTFGGEIAGVASYYLGSELTSLILVKIIIFLVSSVLYFILVLKLNKIETKAKKKDTEDSIILFDEESSSKKSIIPMVVVFVTSFILLIINMFDWESIGVTFFYDLYTKMTEVTIFNDFPIISNILGDIGTFGYWSIYDLTIFIMLITFLIGWIYGLKLDDIIDGSKKGIKQTLKPAFYTGIVSSVFAIMFSSTTGDNIFFTIGNFVLGLSDSFNGFLMIITTAIGSFLYNDFGSLMNAISYPVSILYNDTAIYPLIAIICQSLYGILMFVAPTSVLLIAGLSYFNISYTEWMKRIWKYILFTLVAITIIIIIVSLI